MDFIKIKTNRSDKTAKIKLLFTYIPRNINSFSWTVTPKKKPGWVMNSFPLLTLRPKKTSRQERPLVKESVSPSWNLFKAFMMNFLRLIEVLNLTQYFNHLILSSLSYTKHKHNTFSRQIYFQKYSPRII